MANSAKQPVYKKLGIVKSVTVSIPKAQNMVLQKTAKIGDVTIPWHWQNGTQVKSGIFLNKFFYNTQKSDFGKDVVADVEVVEKTLPDGRAFLMLNITKTDGAPEKTLKVVDGGTDGFPIGYETNKYVCFL